MIYPVYLNILKLITIHLSSSIVDKLGRPIVRIDSIKPINALMLKFGKSITIKSIVNSTGERGFSKKDNRRYIKKYRKGLVY
jgi:hypothetical protein